MALIAATYDIGSLAASWLRSLTARGLSDNTIRIYRRATTDLRAYLLAYEPEPLDPADPDAGMSRPRPTALEGDDGIHREHIEMHITALRKRTSAGNAHQHFRSLKTFFGWLVDEEEIARSPMRTMKAPETGEVEVPIIPGDTLKKLLGTCKGKTFADRRDTAIILMFLDTGARLSEVTERTRDKLDLDINVLHVLGKGNRERPAPFGRTTAIAMDRYLRALDKHLKHTPSNTAPLWYATKTGKALTISGMNKMIGRRCKDAGIPHIHPHQFRHTFAHLWKVNGGHDDALMRIMGWRSREMLSRYGSSAGMERAKKQHGELSPGDRL